MRPPTILCVDTEPNVLLTLKVQLQRHFSHCAVEIAEHGSEALEVVEALVAEGVEVPLVIAGLDEAAPQRDPVLIELHRRYPNIAKVLLVGQATVEDLVNLVNRGGVYRCLNTPWNETDLQETVGAALQHYQQQQHLSQSHQELTVLSQQAQQCSQERQQAQQQLRLFVEHVPAAIAMFDRDMRYILASQRWKTDYDLGEQSIIGRSHYEVFPEIPDRWKAIHQRCLAGATERAEEDHFVRVDGSVTWNQWEIHPWYTDAGEIGGIIMFTQVITDRKQAQLALQESEERNRAILSAVPDIMTIINADGHYLDVAFNQFAGQTIPMKLDGHVTEVLPPEAAQLCLDAIQRVLQTGKPQTYEHQILFGEQVQCEEVHIVPYQTDKVLCMVRDVTERKQAELLLKESEHRLSLALAAAKAGVWEWDMITNQTYWSDENFRLMGYEPGTVETTYDIWLQAVHPEDQTWANDHVSRVTAEDRDLDLEYRVLLPDGSVRWLHDIGQIVKNDQGQPVGMHGIQIDITARKQIELEIVQSRDLREAIFNESADALFLVDPQTLLTLDCNQRAVEMFEADTKAALINIEGHTLQRRQFTSAELEEIAAEISTQSFWSREIEYVTLRGRPFWGNIAAKRIHVAGQALNLVRVTDISKRKQLESQLRQREAFLDSIYTGVEVAISVIEVEPDQTLRYLDFNPACARLSGFDSTVLQGRTVDELAPLVSPADLETVRNQLQYCVTTGQPSQFETAGVFNHQPQWWLNQCAPLVDETGQVYRLVITSTHITDRKQAEAQLEIQNVLLARIAQGAPLGEILHGVITQIEQRVPGAMGSVLLLDEAGCLRHGAAPNLPPAYIQAVDGVRIGNGVGSCGTAAYLKQVVVAADIDTDPCWINYRDFALAHGLRACWSIPLIAADGQVLGTFGLYYAEPRSPQANELEQISQIANLAGIAIERDRAAAQIRRSEEQLKLTLDFTGIGAWSWNPTTDEYAWTQQMVELLEIPLDSTSMFQIWCDRIHPEDISRVQTSIQAALANRSSFAEEYRYRLQDGRWVWRWFKGQGIYTETDEIERVLGIVQDITERKQAEEALAALEAEQRSILENIPGFVAKVDRAGTMLFLNRTAPGFAMAEVVGRNLDEFTAPESRQTQREALERVFATGVAAMIETVGAGPDQTLAYYEVRIAPVFQQEQVEAAIMVVTDVTARKKVEVALRQSEAKQRALISALPDLIMRVSGDGVYLDFFAPNTFSALGTTEDFVGRRVDESLPPHLARKRMNAVHSALRTGELQIYEQEIVVHGIPQIEECRVVVCGANEVLVIGRNISDRKQAELALRESEERRRLALDLTATGSWEFIVATGAATWSDSHYRLMGLAPGEQPSNYQTWRERVHPEDLDWVEQEFAQALATHTLLETEYRVIYPDGTVRWVLTKGQGIYNATDEAVRMVGVMTDVTDRKLAEQALQELNEELELRVQQRTQDLLASQAEVQAKEQFLRGVFEGTDNPLFVVDVLENGSFEFKGWNRASELISGVGSADAIGKSPQQVFPGDVGASIADNYRRCCNEGQMIRYEEHLIFEEGDAWTLTTLTPLKNAQGQIYRIIGSVFDITERKRTEQALQQSEQDLRTIFNNVYDALFIHDLDGEILDVNDRASELCGTTREYLLSATIAELSAPDAPVESIPAIFQQAQAGQTVQTEWRSRRFSDNSTFDTEVVLRPIMLGNRPVYLAGVRDISDRKQAEIELREAQRFAQSIADNTPNIIYIYDLEANRNIYTNREAFEDLGYTSEAIQTMGSAFLETVIHPDDSARCMQYHQQIAQLADGEVLEAEYRMRHADGTWHWLSDRVSVFKRNKAGNVTRYIGAAQDITERKLAEAALAEKNTILRSVIECTPDVVYVKDAAGRYVIVNSGFANFFGQPADQLLGKTDAELLPAEVAAQITANDRRTIEAGVPQTIEETVPRPDGSVRVYLTTKAPWHIPPGNQVGIVGLARDITERKQAEQALFESEQRYATLATAAPVGIYRTNVEGECLYVNERWCNIAGLTVSEAIGTGWLNALHPDDCAMIVQTWNQFVQTGEWFRLEYRFQRPDGTATWVFGQAVPELDENGTVKGYVGTITDISDRKRLEQDLLQINAELEQRVIDRTRDLQYAVEAAQAANRAKSTFLANMSHELRTPLNAILGFSQLLNRDSHLTPDQQEQVKIINRSGGHLLNLINDVLAMSKIESGRTMLTLNCFNLRDLLQDLEELFRLKAQAKQLTLTIEIAPTVPLYIQTDESKLRQVLINLISNGIKFTERGSVTVRAWSEDQPGFSTGDAGSLNLHFEVEDTGLGIAPDEQDKVFEPFEQTASGRNSQEGTGLGMSISRQFVQLMNGELGFRSRLHQGTTFYFAISVKPVEADDELLKTQTAQVIGLAPDQPTYRLLVVEDNADNRQFLVQLLHSVGFEVQTAANGQEAVNLWQTWAPHLIWMDLRMPVMNGYRATQQIRLLEQQTEYRISNRPIAKILALTASAFEDDRALILAAGCDDFLFKPVTETVLFEKIAQHLDVCYRYQEQWSLPAPVKSDDEWLTRELQRMPLDWLAQLRYAARIADEDMMLRILDLLPSTEARLASALKELVTAFAIEKLIELTHVEDSLER